VLSERSAPVATRRRWGAGAFVAIAALLLIVAGAFALLGDGGDDPKSDNADQKPKATATRSPERTATAEPTASATATAAPTEAPATATPDSGNGKDKGKGKGKDKPSDVPGDDAAALQLQAYNLNKAGRPADALPLAQKAVELCKGSTELTCAYALFEYAKALRLTGDPESAIAVLEERQQRFPDNQPDVVAAELEKARAAAG
jgi:cytoskeletal protein RodZ